MLQIQNSTNVRFKALLSWVARQVAWARPPRRRNLTLQRELDADLFDRSRRWPE